MKTNESAQSETKERAGGAREVSAAAVSEELARGLAAIAPEAAYAGLLRGRSVALVGPAATLTGEGLGPFIDSHDLVARLNTAVEHMPFGARLAADIGRRTDVLYCNNEVLVERVLCERGFSHAGFAAACEGAGLKYLVAANNDFVSDADGVYTHPCHAQRQALELLLCGLGLRARFRMLYTTGAWLRGWLDGYVARTGLVAIADLLACEVDRLYVAGMTFYHGGGHLFCEGAPELHPLRDCHGRDTNAHGKGHNSYLELEFLSKLAAHFGRRLSTDERLSALVDEATGRRPA